MVVKWYDERMRMIAVNQTDFRVYRLYRPRTFRLWPRERDTTDLTGLLEQHA
jgi:hypothetical protein